MALKEVKKNLKKMRIITLTTGSLIVYFVFFCDVILTVAPDGQYTYYNVGVLMASHLDSPFDLERCGPAVDLALQEVNERFLEVHKIRLQKVQAR